jgi:hypothetical protein
VQTWDGLTQQCQALAGCIKRLTRKAGNVAARPRQAVDDAAPDRVRQIRKGRPFLNPGAKAWSKMAKL